MCLGSGRLEIMDDAASRHFQTIPLPRAFHVVAIAQILRLAARPFLHLRFDGLAFPASCHTKRFAFMTRASESRMTLLIGTAREDSHGLAEACCLLYGSLPALIGIVEKKRPEAGNVLSRKTLDVANVLVLMGQVRRPSHEDPRPERGGRFETPVVARRYAGGFHPKRDEARARLEFSRRTTPVTQVLLRWDISDEWLSHDHEPVCFRLVTTADGREE
jgi:hypothetical protein